MMIHCPSCGAEYDARIALSDESARRFFGIVKDVNPTLVRSLILYLGLFKPEKTRLQWRRMIKLTDELLPMIKSARLEHNHASYVAPLETWIGAMDNLVDNPPSTLRLPLKSNGYLLSIIAASCEQAAAAAETKEIERARNRNQRREGGLKAIAEVRKNRKSHE